MEKLSKEVAEMQEKRPSTLLETEVRVEPD
jgi:hypothetical protein